jgi:diamine N-acetyltransferase
MTFHIHTVEEKDVAELSDIARRAYQDHYTYLWQDGGEWYKQNMYAEAQLLSEIQDPNVVYYIVYQDNIHLGFIKLKKDYPLSIGSSGLPFGFGEGSNIDLPNALYIDRIYFVKEATGKGIGRVCFDFIEKIALSEKRNSLWLMAMDSSIDAIRFYKKQGFERCGTWVLDFERLKPELRDMTIFYKKIGVNVPADSSYQFRI